MEMEKVSLFKLASQQANWMEVRQHMVARNVANMNTNGYTPVDVVPFKQVLSQRAFGLSTTDQKHMGGGVTEGSSPVAVEVKTDEQGRAKKATLQDELITAGEVRRGYELNTAITKSFHRMILMTTRGA
ncbi:MAG: flagellar basal body rod protein FlgB [Pseudomonadota bacterium]